MSERFIGTWKLMSYENRSGEIVAAYGTYISYCGKYEVTEDRVIHHVEVSFYPNWIGKDQVRFYKFEGDRLILSTPPMILGGKQQSGYLIWERMK